MKKIAISIVLAVIAMALMLVAPAAASEYYLKPDNSGAPYGDTAQVELRINATQEIQGGKVTISHAPGVCANITDISFDSEWEKKIEAWYPDRYVVTFYNEPNGIPANLTAGDYLIGTFTIKCENSSYCVTDLTFVTEEFKTDLWAIDVPHVPFTTDNGTFTCQNRPDLVITSMEEFAINDTHYQVNYTVKNQGNAAAGEFWVNLTIDGTQNTTEHISGLAADATYSGNFSGYIVKMSGDNDTIVVCADYNSTVEEFDETNNCVEQLYSGPPSETVKIGHYIALLNQSITVPIEILSATEVAGGKAKIQFNSSNVTVEEVTSGDFGAPIANINNGEGFVYVAVAMATAVGESEAILANLTFNLTSTGNTSLHIEDAELNNESGNLLTPATIDGSIDVYPLGDLSGNYGVDTGDATLVLRRVVLLDPTTDFDRLVGDMNGNDRIDTGDATLILRKVVGLT